MPTPSQGYRNKDGKRLPSVTTILSRYKDSGALIKWAYRQGRAHAELEAQGLPAPRDLYDKSGETAKAAEAGTIGHNMIEAHILGQAFTADPETDLGVYTRALNAFEQYRRWADQTRIEIVATEMGLVSEAHQYGGTLDAIGKIGDEIVLLDWKTSNAIYGDYLYQLAAYALLLEENRPELTPKGFHILRIAKESADFAHHSYGELDNEKRAFVLMRELYAIDERTKRR
jgi:hypothetical protein